MLDACSQLDADWADGLHAAHVETCGPVTDIRGFLHPKQLEVFECDAPAAEILGGRQGGKTFVDVGWLIEGGLEKPGSVNPYFGLTSSSVADIMWPEVVTWWNLLGWDHSLLHEHTKTAVLPNGSIVKGRGTDDVRTIETARGAKYNRIVIDEMGAQPEKFIRYFVNLLWPTMIKNRGRMLRSGNPGLILRGYWFDHTNPNREVGSPLFHWTAYDNPALGDAASVDAFIDAQVRDDCGLSLLEIKQQIADGVQDGPAITYQREWLARWVQDVGALVFPFLPERNIIKALPTRTPSGLYVHDDGWRRVVASDVGYVDSCAFSILACHPLLQDDYVLRVTKHPQWISPQFVEHMRGLTREWTPCRPPRVDTGGMGKPYAEHCMRAGVAVAAAEKTEKKANVRLFRDRIIAGRVKLLEGECDPLLDECAALGWNKDRDLPEEGKPDDGTYSVVYGWRDLMNFRDKDAPAPKSPAELAREQEEAWVNARLRSSGQPRPIDRTRAAFARR